MTTAVPVEALLLLILIFCLVLAVYFVFAIVSTCYFLCCCDQRSERIKKRQPESESTPTAYAATSEQADLHQVEESVEKVARTKSYQRIGTIEERHPEPVPAASSGQAEVNQVKGIVHKVATCARVYPDLEKLKEELIPDSNILQGPAKVSLSKEEKARISKTPEFLQSKLPPTAHPRKAILTIENEKTYTNYYLRSPAKASKTEVTRRTTQSLPWSAKAKHLYPRCNSAAQACRKSSKRPIPERRLNHVFKASEDDFEIVKRNGIQFFQAQSLLQYWKCKYINRKWKCVEEGLMMAIFNDDGHFLYHESIQATEEKNNFNLRSLRSACQE